MFGAMHFIYYIYNRRASMSQYFENFTPERPGTERAVEKNFSCEI